MILIALGSNLPGRFASPEAALQAAKLAIAARGIRIIAQSSTWITKPVPASDQPLYRNAVIAIATDYDPESLLKVLQDIEHDFGRERSVPNAARIIDLDLIAYNKVVIKSKDLILPHPRLEGRRFVLVPLMEFAADWRHPVTGISARDMANILPVDEMQPLKEAA